MENIVYWLIGIVLAMLGIGLSLFYQGRYLLASESQRQRRARDMRTVGIVWLVIGLAYLGAVLFLLLG